MGSTRSRYGRRGENWPCVQLCSDIISSHDHGTVDEDDDDFKKILSMFNLKNRIKLFYRTALSLEDDVDAVSDATAFPRLGASCSY